MTIEHNLLSLSFDPPLAYAVWTNTPKTIPITKHEKKTNRFSLPLEKSRNFQNESYFLRKKKNLLIFFFSRKKARIRIWVVSWREKAREKENKYARDCWFFELVSENKQVQ